MAPAMLEADLLLGKMALGDERDQEANLKLHRWASGNASFGLILGANW